MHPYITFCLITREAHRANARLMQVRGRGAFRARTLSWSREMRFLQRKLL